MFQRTCCSGTARSESAAPVGPWLGGPLVRMSLSWTGTGWSSGGPRTRLSSGEGAILRAVAPPEGKPFWRTSIARLRPGEITVRGHDLVKLVGRRPFGDVVYLLLAGQPTRRKNGPSMAT